MIIILMMSLLITRALKVIFCQKLEKGVVIEGPMLVKMTDEIRKFRKFTAQIRNRTQGLDDQQECNKDGLMRLHRCTNIESLGCWQGNITAFRSTIILWGEFFKEFNHVVMNT